MDNRRTTVIIDDPNRPTPTSVLTEYRDHGRPVHVTVPFTNRQGTLYRTLMGSTGCDVYEVDFGPDHYGGREIRRLNSEECVRFLDEEGHEGDGQGTGRMGE